MKETRRIKRELVREELFLEIGEDELLLLLREIIQHKYPDFVVSDIEIECGMGQGQGYFSGISVSLVNEVVTKQHKTGATK